MRYQYTQSEQETAPDFDDVKKGLEPGIYPACKLNPPSGDDCAYLRVWDSGDNLNWCDSDGETGADDKFTVEDLCGEEDEA